MDAPNCNTRTFVLYSCTTIHLLRSWYKKKNSFTQMKQLFTNSYYYCSLMGHLFSFILVFSKREMDYLQEFCEVLVRLFFSVGLFVFFLLRNKNSLENSFLQVPSFKQVICKCAYTANFFRSWILFSQRYSKYNEF